MYSTTYVNYQITIVKTRSTHKLPSATKTTIMSPKAYLIHVEEMVMKPSKVPCCMFLLTVLEVYPHKTWQNTKTGYLCSYN